LGIGGSSDMQSAIDTGAPVVKIVKPYRRTELIYKKIHDAEHRGCVAVGMDIDHFYGRLAPSGEVSLENLFSPHATQELRQLVASTKLPFIIKGVLSVSDAAKAAKLGASAIIVSNHGPSALQGSVPSVVALPKIAESIGNKITTLIDSGFQTGNDVLKALALGAKAAGFGRAIILAWAADGAKGVELLINQISNELRRTMAITGCSNLKTVSPSIIEQVHIDGLCY
jgi:4-hydroxymandelate oxidase